MAKEFEPRILAFTCNWCSYAGADFAGTSRFSYPSNIRIIRLMCSGRVNPSFVFRAFEKGADGVLVSGCHPGTCHYIGGNLEAEKRMENTKKILELLGISPDRLRLEWISASEGEKFAETTRDFTKKIGEMGASPLTTDLGEKSVKAPAKTVSEMIKETNVFYCLDCGKCSSSCPVARIDEGYSPRRIVERLYLNPEESFLSSKELWMCLACFRCRERCPSDVRYSELMRACRNNVGEKALEEVCAHGGIPLTLSRMMGNNRVKQNRLGWLPETAKFSGKGEVLYFVGCLPYFDVLFEKLGTESLKIAKSTIRILNEVGIEPAVLKDERCCGHDLRWSGDYENFEKLARANLSEIERSGATKVVSACPECCRTLKQDYSELFGGLDFEVLHLSELLQELVEKGKLEFERELPRKVVYHDSCRLGRHLGIYEPPRSVISSIPGVELLEMKRNRESSICCGVSSWLTCGECSKEMQMDVLDEAQATQADVLVSTCPKCQIHWRCAMSDKSAIDSEKTGMRISDLSILVAEAMNLS